MFFLRGLMRYNLASIVPFLQDGLLVLLTCSPVFYYYDAVANDGKKERRVRKKDGVYNRVGYCSGVTFIL